MAFRCGDEMESVRFPLQCVVVNEEWSFHGVESDSEVLRVWMKRLRHRLSNGEMVDIWGIGKCSKCLEAMVLNMGQFEHRQKKI